MILGARDEASFNRLAEAYWKPVCGYLARRWNLAPEDAADLAQEFFLRLFAEDELKQASPDRGRFRTFLKLKLHDLVIDDLRRRTAQKRGGGFKPVPLDGLHWAGLSPDEAFDRDWASCLMSEAIARLGDAAAFRECVLEHRSYREAAEKLGIKESDVRNQIFRTRARLREIARALVRESVENEAEVDEEFAYLMKLFER